MDLRDPGIKLGSPALQVDSLPTELSGKPHSIAYYVGKMNSITFLMEIVIIKDKLHGILQII